MYYLLRSNFLRSAGRKIVFLLFVLISIQYQTFASHSQSPFWGEWLNAKKLYDSGKYEEALLELKAHPSDSYAYYYNLGTLYYQLKNLSHSVAYLEKANHLHPHDVEIQSNLALARSTLAKSIGLDSLDPASSGLEQISDRISLDEVRATLGLIGLITVLFWIRVYRKKRDVKSTFLKPAGLLGGLGFLITLSIYGIERWSESHPPAICLESLSVRSGPGLHYLELGKTEAGTKIRILGPSATSNPAAPSVVSDASKGDDSLPQSEIWQQVRFSRDGIGWVKSSYLLHL